MYSVSRLVSSSRSCIGVRPAAWTSFSSGSEIMPSGRTGAVRLSGGLFHTEISSRSSGPMRYSPSCDLGSGFGSVGPTAACAAPGAPFCARPGTNAVPCANALVAIRSEASINDDVAMTIRIFMIPSASATGVRLPSHGDDVSAVDGHRDTSLEQRDRQDQQPLVRIALHENAFEVGQWAACDAHALALLQKRMRHERHTRGLDTLERPDLSVGHRVEVVPLLTEHLDESARLDQLEIAGLVHLVVDEQVAREHRSRDEPSRPGATRPDVDFGKEQLEALRRELIVDDLLAVTL